MMARGFRRDVEQEERLHEGEVVISELLGYDEMI
jgi:hypothetical protein